MFRRGRWKVLVILATALALGALVFRWISQPHERTDYVGTVDRASGFRYRFTLYSDWQHLGGGIGESKKLIEMDNFFPPPMSPVRQWMGAHLFHSLSPTENYCMISVRSFKAKGFPLYFWECDICTPEEVQLQGGYPEWGYPSNLGLIPAERILTRRRLMIDGCPATFTQSSIVSNGRTEYSTSLIVYANHSLIYEVLGSAEGSGRDNLDRGMKAITASFRIEKVVSTRDQRNAIL